MTRRVLLLAITALALVTVSGCIGGGGQAPPPIDQGAIKAAIGAVIDGFEDAVETYDVDGMLACLSGADFNLTLQEGTLQPYTKNYATLEGELVADRDKQLAWREPEPDGYGYALDLVLGTQTFSNITATGAIVTQTHEVYESSTALGISPENPLKTDNGTITWHFAKISGEWKATAMTITFEPVQMAGAVARVQAAESRGFGFGVGAPKLGR
jgi:hypothetical protein